jgi:hypothetical protein
MVAAGVAGAAVGAVAANALADDKNPTATEQQAAAQEEEKRWYSWLALGITCSRCSFLCIP